MSLLEPFAALKAFFLHQNSPKCPDVELDRWDASHSPICHIDSGSHKWVQQGRSQNPLVDWADSSDVQKPLAWSLLHGQYYHRSFYSACFMFYRSSNYNLTPGNSFHSMPVPWLGLLCHSQLQNTNTRTQTFWPPYNCVVWKEGPTSPVTWSNTAWAELLIANIIM